MSASVARWIFARAERVGELDLVDLVVAAHAGHDDLVLVGDVEEALEELRDRAVQELGDVDDRAPAGGVHLLGGGGAGRLRSQLGATTAASTLAA